jgi:hypothetical protein
MIILDEQNEMWGTFLSLSYFPTPALSGSGYKGMISACPSIHWRIGHPEIFVLMK